MAAKDLVVVTAKIYSDDREKLLEYAIDHDVNLSWIIRKACKDFIENYCD